MRKIIVRFGEGNRFQEINENRNYFVTEAVWLIEELEKRAAKGTKEVVIHCASNGVFDVTKLFVYTLGNKSFEQELRNVITPIFSAGFLQKMIESESAKFEMEEFRHFIERYDLAYCQGDQKPFPFLLDSNKLYRFYELAKESVGHLFYAKLPSVIEMVGDMLNVIVGIVDLGEPDQQIESDFYIFLEDEGNFSIVGNYIPSRLQSLSPKRIQSLYPNYKPYHDMEKKFFNELPFYMSFDELYSIHLDMLREFELEFNRQLFNGVVFKENYDFENMVLKPVINRYDTRLKEMVQQLIVKDGLEEKELKQAIYG